MAGGGAVVTCRCFRGRELGPVAPSTAAVVREDLSATTPVAATLGYAGVIHRVQAGRGDADLAAAAWAGDLARAGAVPGQ